MCDDYQIYALDKICYRLWYYKMFIAQNVNFLIGFSGLDKAKFRINLKKKYKHQDLTLKIYFQAYLKAIHVILRIGNAKIL